MKIQFAGVGKRPAVDCIFLFYTAPPKKARKYLYMGATIATQKTVTKKEASAPSEGKRPLRKKQKKFVEEYLANNGNATQAAIAAGYSAKAARSIGSENLTKPNILAQLDAVGKKEQEKFCYGLKEHFEELCNLGQVAYQNGDIKTALKAAELKGKLCGLYVERVQAQISADLSGDFVKSFLEKFNAEK